MDSVHPFKFQWNAYLIPKFEHLIQPNNTDILYNFSEDMNETIQFSLMLIENKIHTLDQIELLKNEITVGYCTLKEQQQALDYIRSFNAVNENLMTGNFDLSIDTLNELVFIIYSTDHEFIHLYQHEDIQKYISKCLCYLEKIDNEFLKSILVYLMIVNLNINSKSMYLLAYLISSGILINNNIPPFSFNSSKIQKYKILMNEFKINHNADGLIDLLIRSIRS
ncbi:hypothetical protein [Acinetobacter sp. Marseille-Q1618]|uniref:hypothetical protein n=1 Tax=Acinetobacter sp. Marseille-Q1618 TaxID=2697502 RepID=UPI00156E8894|nr:hypothetical protein [Acinetobacter sp. Marseille-Q1618]